MIGILNLLPDGLQVFDQGRFCLEKWKQYIQKLQPGCETMFLSDVEACLQAGYTWEENFLPVLEKVPRHPALKMLEENFILLTADLEEKIMARFGRGLDADIVLYLGLCNGAGWVEEMDGRTKVLLGAEKILELGWYPVSDMQGLIFHELGHVYQARWGTLERQTESSEKQFVWQLFTEGIAMVFEQELAGDSRFFHQDKDGWLQKCEALFPQMLFDFAADLPRMTRENQRFFGDWVRYEGIGDGGYYLGARFVRHLMEKTPFDLLISLDADQVYDAFLFFARQYGKEKEE